MIARFTQKALKIGPFQVGQGADQRNDVMDNDERVPITDRNQTVTVRKPAENWF